MLVTKRPGVSTRGVKSNFQVRSTPMRHEDDIREQHEEGEQSKSVWKEAVAPAFSKPDNKAQPTWGVGQRHSRRRRPLLDSA